MNEIAIEFMEVNEKVKKLGYEVIGSKLINDDQVYFIVENKKQKKVF